MVPVGSELATVTSGFTVVISIPDAVDNTFLDSSMIRISTTLETEVTSNSNSPSAESQSPGGVSILTEAVANTARLKSILMVSEVHPVSLF